MAPSPGEKVLSKRAAIKRWVIAHAALITAEAIGGALAATIVLDHGVEPFWLAPLLQGIIGAIIGFRRSKVLETVALAHGILAPFMLLALIVYMSIAPNSISNLWPISFIIGNVVLTVAACVGALVGWLGAAVIER